MISQTVYISTAIQVHAQGMPAAEEYAVNTDLEGQIEHVRQKMGAVPSEIVAWCLQEPKKRQQLPSKFIFG